MVCPRNVPYLHHRLSQRFATSSSSSLALIFSRNHRFFRLLHTHSPNATKKREEKELDRILSLTRSLYLFFSISLLSSTQSFSSRHIFLLWKHIVKCFILFGSAIVCPGWFLSFLFSHPYTLIYIQPFTHTHTQWHFLWISLKNERSAWIYCIVHNNSSCAECLTTFFHKLHSSDV